MFPNENPYRARRLDYNLTQREVADICGVTTQSVLMLEQGLFNTPPASLTTYFPNLVHAYQDWRLTQRRDALFNIQYHQAPLWLDFRISIHPTFKGFCRTVLFQPSILREFETKWYSKDLMVTCLTDCQVEPEYVTYITDRSRVIGDPGHSLQASSPV